MTAETDRLAQEIEQRLEACMPQVELLACESTGPERLRVVIDDPDGVDLALCERVTGELRDLLVKYAIEVSSPGPERPLVKPDHFRRFIGRRARVRTRAPLGRRADRSSIGRAPDHPLAGHRSFTGELVGASDDEVTVAADDGVISIPYTEIHRSNLIAKGEQDR